VVAGALTNDLRWGLHAYRGKTHHHAALPHGRDVGQHPVKVAILAPVLDHAGPGPPCLQVLPHIGKCFHRHVRMANHVVRLAHQFLLGPATGFDEVGVGKGDDALQIGARDGRLVVAQGVFSGSDRLIVAHRVRVVKFTLFARVLNDAIGAIYGDNARLPDWPSFIARTKLVYLIRETQ